MIPASPSLSRHSFWVIVPAAGIGARMLADRPKQYLRLGDRTVAEWTLSRLLAHPRIDQLMVAVAADDPYWSSLPRVPDRVHTCVGGATRDLSVRNALQAIADHGAASDWVLVHDIARPCVDLKDISRLMDAVEGANQGGILAAPMADTVKRAGPDGRIVATVDRQPLWRAFTPQMFRIGELLQALLAAQAAGDAVTDEASAMERVGVAPLLVEGRSDNIKITHPADLALAGQILEAQRLAGES